MTADETLEAESPNRQFESHTFATSDGVELFYRVWPPAEPSKKAVILFHRGHEHSARWQDFIDRIDLSNCWFVAWDARGYGHSPGERGYAKSFGRMVRDAYEFVQHVSQRHDLPVDSMAVVSQSVGSVVAATLVHDYALPIRALVLATPALRVKLYVPFALPGLRLLAALGLSKFIKSYVKPRMLTHDEEQAQLYANDELISPQIATNILIDLYDTSTRLIADAGAIHAPTLLLISGNDWVVRRGPQEMLFDGITAELKERELYPDFYHSTFWEKERAKPISRCREFIDRCFDAPIESPNLLDDDELGYSKGVYDDLQRPLSVFSPKRWSFALQSLGLKTLGRLSQGVQVGWRTGFDSGESLDHVYRNTPEGITVIGRLIDRFYLNTPGWRGIRQRKVHLAAMLDRAIASLSETAPSVRILDIASGPGRYVLEATQRHSDIDISAVLCDRDEGGLAAGRTLAESFGITSVEYLKSDAFDSIAIASHQPPPNIAVVSGLYELFPQNDRIRDSLRGMAEAVPAGGFLIYTNQPWHPQQEMIARVLPNRDGDPWVMRCRTQSEMDQLVSSVGFNKIDMLIDDDGIFSVSLAVRQ